MTYQEFLIHLSATKRAWTVNHRGHIRMGNVCPITSLISSDFGDWHIAVRKFNIDFMLALDIVMAADNEITSYEAIRKDLLQACGIRGVYQEAA